MDTAFYQLAHKAGRPVICICGSMYLVGEALSKLSLEACQ